MLVRTPASTLRTPLPCASGDAEGLRTWPCPNHTSWHENSPSGTFCWVCPRGDCKLCPRQTNSISSLPTSPDPLAFSEHGVTPAFTTSLCRHCAGRASHGAAPSRCSGQGSRGLCSPQCPPQPLSSRTAALVGSLRLLGPGRERLHSWKKPMLYLSIYLFTQPHIYLFSTPTSSH